MNGITRFRCLNIHVLVKETFSNLQSLRVDVIASADESLSEPRVVGSSGEFPAAILVEGNRFSFPVLVPEEAGTRFVTIKYVVTGGDGTYGKITAFKETLLPAFVPENPAATDDLREAERELYSAASTGLASGNLLPLATYLRSPYPLHPVLARELANCIDDPRALYKVQIAKKPNTGPANVYEGLETRLRIARVGHFIELHRANRNHHQRALDQAEKEFPQLSRTTIGKLWREYLKHKAAGQIREGKWMPGPPQ